ncbi:hypothetical protein C1D09_032425 [Mesorhizobium intechi]|uniref:hypothetical protein n=1 Tax=Mesorhizobium intechi TaxID=537601 RepID=UPI000CBF554D|nr:hypothetical protein [Mesorhizobium intechi]TSE00214.1 hypothetical protein C1D09_032425 [Mesorhizobium intechi]
MLLPIFGDFSRFLCAAVLCTTIAGCMPEDGFRRYAGAVGPDLYSKQTVANTVLLDAYTDNICTQAGLASGGQCAIRTTNDWKNFVDMGLYDIDQRCDSFLDGLYYKAKTGDSFIAQISDTGSFAASVLDATSSSVPSIKIVAAAFGLAENTFRNTNKTLLEALDATTVKSLVFRRQQDIKQEIYRTTIWNKPEALHALRTYLRVCMPFAIEMEANAVLTTAQRTDGDIGTSPITFDRVSSSAPLGGDSKVDKGRARSRTPAPGWEAINTSGSPITNDRAVHIQKALCFPSTAAAGMPKADGVYGDQTRAALQLFIASQKAGLDAQNWQNADVKISPTYLRLLLAASETPCPNGSRNYLERVLFNDVSMASLSKSLKDSLGSQFTEGDGVDNMRKNLRKYKELNGSNAGPGGIFIDQLTPEVAIELKLVKSIH